MQALEGERGGEKREYDEELMLLYLSESHGVWTATSREISDERRTKSEDSLVRQEPRALVTAWDDVFGLDILPTLTAAATALQREQHKENAPRTLWFPAEEILKVGQKFEDANQRVQKVSKSLSSMEGGGRTEQGGEEEWSEVEMGVGGTTSMRMRTIAEWRCCDCMLPVSESKPGNSWKGCELWVRRQVLGAGVTTHFDLVRRFPWTVLLRCLLEEIRTLVRDIGSKRRQKIERVGISLAFLLPSRPPTSFRFSPAVSLLFPPVFDPLLLSNPSFASLLLSHPLSPHPLILSSLSFLLFIAPP
eukprot:759164-Hanusia_phi.AAC.1